MAPPKSAASSSSSLNTADFITGARVITGDLNLKPYSRTVVDWLDACHLLPLCSFAIKHYSLILADDFHRQMKVTRGTGKFQGSLRNQEIKISTRTLGRVFGLPHNEGASITISAEDMDRAWQLMRPGTPMTGRFFTRKEFSPEIYLLSDIVDKVFLCKTGNKDKFTDEQLRITAAIYLRLELNWAGLLMNQIQASVLSVAQENNPKRRFVRIINYLLQSTYPNLPMASGEFVSHTALKEVNMNTLRSLEKVLQLGDMSLPAASSASKPAATQATPKQARPPAKRQATSSPPSKAAKKQRKPTSELSEEELAAKVARMMANIAAEEAAAEQQRRSSDSSAPDPSGVPAESSQPSTHKFKRLRKTHPDTSKTHPAKPPTHPAKPPTHPKPTKPSATSHRPKPSATPSQQPPTSSTTTEIPIAQLVLTADEARAIVPKEYDSIFNDLPATWVRTDPFTDPDVVFPIAHLPNFLYNLIAFHAEGRDRIWYREKYFSINGTPIRWTSRSHMGKDAILAQFGKYLNTMSHFWNEAYCQSSFADQDRLVNIQVGKYLEKTGYSLATNDPFHQGVRIPHFSEVKCFGAIYAPASNPSASTIIEEILSAPTKADLITLGRDLSGLSEADAALVRDIISQLGAQDEPQPQGEPSCQGEPAIQGEPSAKITPEDSGEESDGESDEVPLIRTTRPPATSGSPASAHQQSPIQSVRSPSPPPSLHPSPPTSPIPSPQPKSPSPIPHSPTPSPIPSPKSPTPPAQTPTSPAQTLPSPQTPPAQTPPSPPTPPPQPTPTPPPSYPNTEVEFTAFMASRLDSGVSPSLSCAHELDTYGPASVPVKSNIASTSGSHPSSAAAHAFIPIPSQLENKLIEAIRLLEKISTQLVLLQASQQEGFKELAFRHNTNEINQVAVTKRTEDSFLQHTRVLLTEVTKCFAQGGPRERSVEAQAEHNARLYKEVRDAEDAATNASKGERQMRALNIRLLDEINDLRRQLNLSAYINIPDDRNKFSADQAQFEVRERIKRAAEKAEEAYRKEKEKNERLRQTTIISDDSSDGD